MVDACTGNYPLVHERSNPLVGQGRNVVLMSSTSVDGFRHLQIAHKNVLVPRCKLNERVIADEELQSENIQIYINNAPTYFEARSYRGCMRTVAFRICGLFVSHATSSCSVGLIGNPALHSNMVAFAETFGYWRSRMEDLPYSLGIVQTSFLPGGRGAGEEVEPLGHHR